MNQNRGRAGVVLKDQVCMTDTETESKSGTSMEATATIGTACLDRADAKSGARVACRCTVT